LLLAIILAGTVSSLHADIYVCKRADGTEIYSDQSLGGQCRKLQNLPHLIPAPRVPSEESKPEAVTPRMKDADPVPVPGGGRRIDPPADDAIVILDVKAFPNYNSMLGIAHYQANMRLQNGDSDWTAEEICVDVRFRDIAKVFIDVLKTGCLDGLKPMDDRPFTVVYTGTIPARLSPIQAEAKVSSVRWAK
jgi:hypothetical protein